MTDPLDVSNIPKKKHQVGLFSYGSVQLKSVLRYTAHGIRKTGHCGRKNGIANRPGV